ncbi:MAG: 30S ribosomal protein S20 [Candidatus Jorgensenbacteria bacterium GW2011_GWA1_48_11]|uniref:Small ribosomal subunit protein bS20 n=1 Tax=Candidatus Jorgensenbacteria bacterium GW2011_GWA1_48_11 TaxID=1618660 RepID=A0A0G1UBQ2_9BACT|nr:MAG: 30S ribosomal protein S20 [Candidatus Jorgensenbacteria bacterium GW2011_GWA1_48_11]KKW12047.1 MAG: 30S ribosomal protein S20 [Candidatus Jorgensenbacteria bacterium GW2011_GWB1_49_9]
MPRTKSAKKALRQNARRRESNLKRKIALRETLKEFQKLVRTGKLNDAKKYLPQVYKKLDKLAKIDFIKFGRADRLKSRLAKKVK